ncbi:MAG: PilZ domain-containing protein [Methylovulum sp.]|nr:PilZ domain-containing protein [Methylovulum sp.]
MNPQPNRPYRKSLTSQGLIYMAEQEHEVTVQNLSISGALAKLNNDWHSQHIKDIFSILSASTSIDLYLPELRLAGEAEVVRVDTVEDHHITLALEFKNVAYYADQWQHQRTAYRKNVSDIGRIVLNGAGYNFTSVNVSMGGLMIRIAETVAVKPGSITQFEFKPLGLAGNIKIIWADTLADIGTFIGLQYVKLQNNELKGIPRFHK